MGSKAAVGAGSVPLSSAIVLVALWALGLQPPQEVVLGMNAIVGAVVAYAAVYVTPHS